MKKVDVIKILFFSINLLKVIIIVLHMTHISNRLSRKIGGKSVKLSFSKLLQNIMSISYADDDL